LNLKKKIRHEINRFVSNKRGIIWVWCAVFLAMVIYSIGWFTLGIAFIKVVGVIEENYNFVGGALQTANLIKNLIVWHPIFALGGWLIFGIANSGRVEVRSYEA